MKLHSAFAKKKSAEESKDEFTFNSHTRNEIIIKSDELGLTPYEYVRTPRFPNNDSDVLLKHEYEKLKYSLECPICLSLMNDPVYVKPCMHRFCRSCISHIFSQKKKQCPSCRVEISSKRKLQPDKELSEVILKLFPDREAVQKYEQESVFQELAKLKEKREISTGIKRTPGKRTAPEPTKVSYPGLISPTEGNSVEYKIAPSPLQKSSKELPKCKLRTVKEVTVEVVVMVLGFKLEFNKAQLSRIKLAAYSHETKSLSELKSDDTIELINRIFWKNKDPRIIFYKIN